MRSALIAFGGGLGLVVMVIAGRYGFMGADTAVDAVLSGVWNAGLAAGGLFGFAVSARVARVKGRAAGAVVAFCALIFLAFSLTNTLGFWTGRGAARDAEAARLVAALSADHASLEAKQAERVALVFQPTSREAVDAAGRAARAARSSADAECGVVTGADGAQSRDPNARRGAGRGANCRRLEDTAAEAEAEAARLAGAIAATDRAAALDLEIEQLKARIRSTGAGSGETSGQGAALARLLSSAAGVELDAVTAEAWQRFGMSAAIELLILMSLVSAEWIRPGSIDALGARQAGGATRVDNAAGLAAEAAPVLNQASARDARRILGEVLEPSPGEMLALDDVAQAFAVSCRRDALRPMDPATFSRALAKFCKAQRLEVATSGAQPEIVGVRIAAIEFGVRES